MKKALSIIYPAHVGRVRFIATVVLTILAYWVPASILDSRQPNLTAIDNTFYSLLFFLSPFLIFLIFATTIKRLRDIGEPGWWSLLLVAPYLNAAFILVLALLPRTQKTLTQKERFVRVAIFTVIVAAAPFVIYFYQRYVGILPSAEEWYSQGNNHGPWRYTAAGFSLFYPIVAAIAVAVVEAIKGSDSRYPKAIVIGMLLVALQVVALGVQFYALWWTVD
jgi:uncharacterized membrane protein YhaH (DUF805 family)